MGRPRFRTLAHGADLRVAIWGDDERELICNAVRATMTLALGTNMPFEGRHRVAIRPWPEDLASRLVRAVNEALFALYVRHEVATDFEATAGGATLELGPLPAGVVPELEVKAATYHDLRPRRRGDRLGAMLTLDV
ncbi:MAG: archease [Thermoanaerobaculaceae bacterium]|jgi:SHS2 domain-containing protein